MVEVKLEYSFTCWLVRCHPANVMLDGLRETADRLYDDEQVIAVLTKLRGVYSNKKECLIHRDLHSGSVMVKDDDVKV